METYFYFSVKTVCCGYLFYRLWIFLFRQRIYGLWEDMVKYLPKKKGKSAEPVTAPKVDDNEVIGKTNIVYLEDPEIDCKVPARSEPLPPAEEMKKRRIFPRMMWNPLLPVTLRADCPKKRKRN